MHHFAKFTVEETEQQFSVTMDSVDDSAKVHVAGSVSNDFPASSIFETLAEASKFFEQGSLGYSDTKTEGVFDGLELDCIDWNVESLKVDEIQSSYFQDNERFPPGAVEFGLCVVDAKHRPSLARTSQFCAARKAVETAATLGISKCFANLALNLAAANLLSIRTQAAPSARQHPV